MWMPLLSARRDTREDSRMAKLITVHASPSKEEILMNADQIVLAYPTTKQGVSYTTVELVDGKKWEITETLASLAVLAL